MTLPEQTLTPDSVGRLREPGNSRFLAGVGGVGEVRWVIGDWCSRGDGERTPAPRTVPTERTDQQRPLRRERDPLQGIRQRVPRRWAMGARRPEAEVGRDLRDDVGLLEEHDEETS